MNNIDKKFWEFVDFVNWMEISKVKLDFDKLVLDSIANKYTYAEFDKFRYIARKYNNELRTNLRDIWLSKRNKYGPSDDGYSDLCSSIIGKGETFCKLMISCDVENYEKEYLKMAKDRDYFENFMYIFQFNDEELYKESSRIEKLNKLLNGEI